MKPSIHGHEVLNMMISSNRNWTRDSLINEIEQRFGADASFHTCSASDMNAAELVDFLQQHGKFIENKNGFVTDNSKICQH